MADLKISQLSDGGASQATDEYVIARSGANYRIDGASVAAAATSVGTLSSLTVSGNANLATSSGSVGVGTASPLNKFSVVSANGQAGLNAGTSVSPVRGNLWYDTDGTGWKFQIGKWQSSAFTPQMTFVDDGKVGIATASPDGQLTIAGSVNATGILNALTLRNASDGGVGLYFDNSVSSNLASIEAQVTGSGAGTDDGKLVFATAADGVNVERMYLDASGNLGIGRTPSGYTLDITTGGNGLRIERSGVEMGGYISSSLPHWGTLTNHDFVLMTNGAAKARLDTIGHLLVGATANPGILNRSVVIDSGSSSLAGYILQNDTTGRTSTDGSALYISGSSLNLYNLENSPMVFGTNNTERARITSGGNVLVGKTADDTTTAGVQITSGGIVNSAGITDFFNAYSTSAAAYRFYVTNGGTIFATSTTISAISDARLKENIRDLDVGLDAILALKPRKYDWKEGKGQDKKDVRGFIAQEFEEVFPDLIDEWKDPAPEGEEPYRSVRADLIPVLVKAIQELDAKNKALEARLEALEA